MGLLAATTFALGIEGNPVKIFAPPIVENRAPQPTDVAEEGRVWIDPSNEDVYICTKTAGTSTWINSGGGDGVFSSLTVNPGPTTLTGGLFADFGIFSGSLNAGVTQVSALDVGSAVNGTVGLSTIFSSTNGTGGPEFELKKSRLGSTILSGDAIGLITFEGFDGSGVPVPVSGAEISAVSTGVIAANQVPGILRFSTASATGVLTLRAGFDQDGIFTILSPDTGRVAIVASASDIEADQLVANDDVAGTAAKTTFTNGTVANVAGGGTLSIDSQSANPGTQAGFIKIYVGTTTGYIPYFTDISP